MLPAVSARAIHVVSREIARKLTFLSPLLPFSRGSFCICLFCAFAWSLVAERFVDPGFPVPASISQGFIRVNGEHAIILSKLNCVILATLFPLLFFPKEFLIFSSASRKNFEADLALFFTRTIHSRVAGYRHLRP